MNLSPEVARERMKYCFQTYGLTLKGLRTEYNVNDKEYLDYVYDSMPYGMLRLCWTWHWTCVEKIPMNEKLISQLQTMKAKKLVFTNSHPEHYHQVLSKLGVENCFDGFIDIYSAKWNPKVTHCCICDVLM